MNSTLTAHQALTGHIAYKEKARKIAKKALNEGLRVWLADDGQGAGGCFCGTDGGRVVSFGVSTAGVRFSGYYGPPSTHSGTGWDITTEEPETLASLLTARPFRGCRFQYFTTIDQFMKTYGAICRYREMTPADFEEEAPQRETAH
jgi:hypothetical protein